ncbi:hypothetical protein NON20_10070 [Synechocystis sp. B12]|nr:hypothetical protein NON20_10070 [Synechocystis sp. B12]
MSKLNTNNLRAALEKVLTEDSYKRNTLELQQTIKTAGGVTNAADIIEQVTAEAMG